MPSRSPVLVRTALSVAALGALVVFGTQFVQSRWEQSPKMEVAGDPSNANGPVEGTSEQHSSGPSLAALLGSNVAIDRNDPVQMRILADYGAVFVTTAVAPPTVVFSSEDQVRLWQSSVDIEKESVGGITIELQAPAMKALLAARAEAKAARLDITPRGADGARRGYDDTVRLWTSRVDPALDHWVARNRLTPAERDRIRSLSPRDQIPEVLALEKRGVYFSTGFDKSILYSVAAPGTSQHLSMLALDVSQFENAEVRRILSRHGWFQTVVSDLPHFTYLGVAEETLPSLGLKKVTSGGRVFWIPDLSLL